jgi:hypothetical protein
MVNNTQEREMVSGKVIRSGHVPGGGSEQPIIEVDGKLQFSLPGEPIFPSLGDDTVLKPSFNWLLQTDKGGKLDAEVGYVTEGFTWEADYNLVSPEKGDDVDLIGWVTIGNNSGTVFENAHIKLMAGDVNKIQRNGDYAIAGNGAVPMAMTIGGGAPVTEKTFDDFHLYSIARPTTLHDRETKQVEFVKATGVHTTAIYVYDGAAEYGFYGGLNQDSGYGTQCNKKVAIYREFINAETYKLGMPLPKGRLRFYRRDADGQLEFVGENTIDHTPRNETLRITTGNAFDMVGERIRKNYVSHLNLNDPVDPSVAANYGGKIPDSYESTQWIDESFEIKLRNRKKEPARMRAVEHLYRWSNWSIVAKSNDFKKTDSQTIEFNVMLQPDEEKIITYTVHYTW